ncbi:Protein chup1, chloroplastic [Ancistrocladus abbreviatus]
MELQSRASFEKDPGTDYMLLQGVRFAFKIHQFAGGFDADTMQAFEELRKLAHVLNKKIASGHQKFQLLNAHYTKRMHS